jgi:uncharacterized protein YndB with AHSA1/START domain
MGRLVGSIRVRPTFLLAASSADPRHSCGLTMGEPSISVSRDVAAPAAKIFSVLAQPATHAEVDGSGMLRTAIGDMVISKVGDVFSLNMVNDQIGDYVMENRVVEFEADRRIVWEPVMRSATKPEIQSNVGEAAHHQWGWQLEPLDDHRTRVTEFFDCSRSPDWLKEATEGGESWRPAIEASLENLEKLVVGS